VATTFAGITPTPPPVALSRLTSGLGTKQDLVESDGIKLYDDKAPILGDVPLAGRLFRSSPILSGARSKSSSMRQPSTPDLWLEISFGMRILTREWLLTTLQHGAWG